MHKQIDNTRLMPVDEPQAWLKIGVKVRWMDPELSVMDLSRVYTVLDIRDYGEPMEEDTIILISDGIGETECLPGELIRANDKIWFSVIAEDSNFDEREWDFPQPAENTKEVMSLVKKLQRSKRACPWIHAKVYYRRYTARGRFIVMRKCSDITLI